MAYLSLFQHADRYAELRCKTNFSFLEGASHPDELATRAVELGYAALAITDRNSLAGVERGGNLRRDQRIGHGRNAEIGIEIRIKISARSRRVAYGRERAGKSSRLRRARNEEPRLRRSAECRLASYHPAHATRPLRRITPRFVDPAD